MTPVAAAMPNQGLQSALVREWRSCITHGVALYLAQLRESYVGYYRGAAADTYAVVPPTLPLTIGYHGPQHSILAADPGRPVGVSLTAGNNGFDAPRYDIAKVNMQFATGWPTIQFGRCSRAGDTPPFLTKLVATLEGTPVVFSQRSGWLVYSLSGLHSDKMLAAVLRHHQPRTAEDCPRLWVVVEPDDGMITGGCWVWPDGRCLMVGMPWIGTPVAIPYRVETTHARHYLRPSFPVPEDRAAWDPRIGATLTTAYRQLHWPLW